MAIQKAATSSVSHSNSIALFIANLIFFAGIILIAAGAYNVWRGDTEGIILLVPGIFSLVLGWVFDDLLRKWCD